MPRGRPFRSQGRRQRLTQWGPGRSAAEVLITSGTQVLWTLGSTVTEKATIVRIRGLAALTMTTSDAAGAGFFGAMGLAMVSDEALAAGAGSIPSPLTALDFPWVWHSFFDIRGNTATIADGVNAPLKVLITIDNKGMRKQTPGQTLVGIIDQVESTNAVAELHSATRILDMLG